MREQLKELKQKGISYSFVAKQLQVSRSLISKFAAAQCNLSENNEQKLKALIEQMKGVK